MPQLRVLLGFAQASDSDLQTLAGNVLKGMIGNTVFPSPPVTLVALQTALTGFTNAIAAQAQGGTAATAHKNDMREALIALLRQLALYVQQTAKTLADLLSSGFEAVSTNRAQAQLDKPTIGELLNGLSTQLIVRMPPVDNAKAYEVRVSSVPGQWLPGGLYGSTRDMIIHGLTPGTMYTVQVRAIGGLTGYSDWSDPVSHMSM